MKINSLYNQIIAELEENADDKLAAAEAYYHKYKPPVCYGMRAGTLDKIAKSFMKQIVELPCKDAVVLAERFYKTRIQEQVFMGNFVLQHKLYCLSGKNFKFLDKVVGYLVSWSTVDDFCSDVLQPLLLKYPKEGLISLRKWNKSKDIWRQRTSVVAFTRKVGESGQFTKEALELCEYLIESKKDLIQKAVGWCLKDIMRGDKKIVFEYVKKLRARGISAVVTLYAIRDLKGKDRDDVLKIKAKTP